MNAYLSQKIKKISFLLMIMVVILHSYNIDIKQGGKILYFEKGFNWFIQNFISNGLTRIAVPLFFIISGYLFFIDQKYDFPNILLKIKKRIKTLMIPYLIWALLGLFLYFILQSIPQSKSFFTKKLIIDYSFFDWMNAIFNEPIPYQLWFLKDLIILVFLSPILYFIVRKFKIIFLLVLFCFWIYNQDSIFLTSEALLFFSIGVYMSIFTPSLIDNKNKSAYLFLFFWITILFLKTAIGFYDINPTCENILLKISILIGIVAFWSFYDRFNSSKKWNTLYIEIVGFSFFLYLFHEPLLTIIKKFLFSKLPKTQEYYLLVYFLAPLIVIVLTLLIGAFLKSKLNPIYKFITGNR